MTRVVKSIAEFKDIRKNVLKGKSIGFVPTMGALHEGHLSLIKRANEENEIVVSSVFVNPTQFNDKNDLDKYPRTFEEDLLKLTEMKVDYLFFPEYDEMYPDNYKYKISENDLSAKLCGAHRPGHFDGVLSVVMKLLNIVSPDKAYFGEKDYQQYLLLKGMAETFFMDVEIVPCPIIREEDGLAKSSRNTLLSETERELAPSFYKYLSNKSLTEEEVISELTNAGFIVDYIEKIDNRRFGAVHLGNVRLIDNVKI